MPTYLARRFSFASRWMAARPIGVEHFDAVVLAVFALVAFAGCSRREEPSAVTLALTTRAAGTPSLVYESASDNWPGWRGGGVGGVARGGRNLPAQWSTTSGVRWKSHVFGQGNSSPVVWNDRVFVSTSRQQEGGVELGVLCFDRANGNLLWTNEPATTSAPTHRKNGFASATPVTDGQRLYVSFGSAGLFCFDLGGRKLWHVSLAASQHEWGTAASPIVFADTVIQVCDQPEGSFVAAFDCASGVVRWRTPRESDGSWSTPVVVEAVDGARVRPELVINGSGSGRGAGWVTAYNPWSGAELWRVHGTTEVVCPTPIVAPGLVISTSGRNGPTLAIRTGGDGDVTSSHVAWKHGRGGAYVPTGVAVGDRLYTIRDVGVLECFDVRTGKSLWQERLRGSFTASLVAGDGKIYATSEQGVVYVVAAADEFDLLATNRMDERCLATPAVAGGELFIRTESQLYCIAGEPRPAVVVADDGDASPSDSDDALARDDDISPARPGAVTARGSSPPIQASPMPAPPDN
jgi:hypothetical protein